MSLTRRLPRTGYLLACLVTAIILITRHYFGSSWIAGILTSLEFILGIIVTASVGGWRPGMLATLLCILGATFFFIEPYYSFRVDEARMLISLLPYAVLGPALSFLCDSLHGAWMRIAERQKSLEVEIDERKRVEKALQLADKRKDEFLATLAHELRNPLAPIATGLQVLQFSETDSETRSRVQAIMQRQVESMVRLIDDLLDVARISRGKVDLRREPVELSAVVTRAVETVQPFINEKKQTLAVSLPDMPVVIDVDPVRFAQVLANLLNNASKFSEEHTQIELIAEKLGSQLSLRVKDRGHGLSQEAVNQVFDLFWQNKLNVGGTTGLGIGLTLAQRLVEMHGGRITASSDGPGKGSTFEIIIPTLENSNALRPKSGSERRMELKPSRRRVLVVDDNADAAESLAKLLRLRSYDVQIAHNGMRALETAVVFLPHVVLLDISMPGMDGYEVARRLRALPESSDTMLVALSGYGRDADVRRSLEAGFHQHLTKPATIETLRSVLEARPMAN